VLPDGTDQTDIGGLTVRKGSVAAFVLNARTFESPDVTAEDRAQAAAMMVELAPALAAVGVLDVFEPRSEAIRDLLAGVDTSPRSTTAG
jgi:hypothetical protein